MTPKLRSPTVSVAACEVLSAELPTYTVYSPGLVTNPRAPQSQTPNGWLVAPGSMVIFSGFDPPGSTKTFWKPTSRFGGCPSTGIPRYTCTTSAPATRPVLVTDAVTVTGALAPSGASSDTSAISNVV